MIERHFHWRFTAYNGPVTEDGRFAWPVRVDVIGYLSEADARVAAQDVLQREFFQLADVWECASCGFQQQQVESMKRIAEGHDK